MASASGSQLSSRGVTWRASTTARNSERPSGPCLVTAANSRLPSTFGAPAIRREKVAEGGGGR
jgi:hypothetical protein